MHFFSIHQREVLLCSTAMINHVFISFSAVQIFELSYIHLKKILSINFIKTGLIIAVTCIYRT